MSEAEIEKAARSDCDNPPLSETDLKHMPRVPRVKTLRRALGLTQEEFSARYCIPLGTLRDWEQGRGEPDQPARAYLAVISHNPEGVERAFRELPTPWKPERAVARKRSR
jgi:putative transcriptional regulator